MSKHPEVDSVVQHVCKMLSGTEYFAGCTPVKVAEGSEWTSAVNSAEENRANYCKAVDGKPLFKALYGMYKVALNKLKAALKLGVKAGQNGVMK
jgi:hypothetical protein